MPQVQAQRSAHAGIWGMRVADLAARYGANVVELTTGGEARSFSLDEIRSAVEAHKPALLFLCQGESSMGKWPAPHSSLHRLTATNAYKFLLPDSGLVTLGSTFC